MPRQISNVEKLAVGPLSSLPPGSLWFDVAGTDPNVKFGGTWIRFGEGMLIVGSDSENPEIDIATKVRGLNQRQIMTNNLPVHAHTVQAHNHSVTDHTHPAPDHTHNDDHYHGIAVNAAGIQAQGIATNGDPGHYWYTAGANYGVASGADVLTKFIVSGTAGATSHATAPFKVVTMGGGGHAHSAGCDWKAQGPHTAYMYATHGGQLNTGPSNQEMITNIVQAGPTSATGGDTPLDITPLQIAVNIWRRIA